LPEISYIGILEKSLAITAGPHSVSIGRVNANNF
jgi:hypothetical protein